MLLSLSALSILFIPFTLTEAARRPPVLDTHVQYGLNLTFAGSLKSGRVRYIQAAFGSPEQEASTAHTRQIWPKEARFCEAAFRPPERVWGPLYPQECVSQEAPPPSFPPPFITANA